MAVNTGQVAVSTTATAIFDDYDPLPGGGQVTLANTSEDTDVYLGTAAVTTSTGLPLAAGTAVTVQLTGNSVALYGITASGSATVAYLRGDA